MTEKLMCVHQGTVGDYNLYWSTFDGQSWIEDTPFSNGAETADRPALCILNGSIYCIHSGTGNLSKIWCSKFDPATGDWTVDTPFQNNAQTFRGPAAVVFQDKLYCVYMGEFDGAMYWTVFNESTQEWDNEINLFAEGTNLTWAPPALATVNGQTLFCVHRGQHNDDGIYWTQFDPSGQVWSPDTQFPGNLTSAGPALTYWVSNLLCVHVGRSGSDGALLPGDPSLWWSVFDGSQWSPDKQFSGGNQSNRGPALCQFQDKLYCIHRGAGDENVAKGDYRLYYATFEVSDWTQDIVFGNGNLSESGPALAVVDFPSSEKN